MSLTLTALLEQPPGIDGLTRALVAAGPALRVRLVADGALVQLRDEDGHLVATVRAAEWQATAAEAERVLDVPLPDEAPAQPWWVEARATTRGRAEYGARGVVRRFGDCLVEYHGGVVREPLEHLPPLESFLRAGTDDPVTAAVTEHTAVVVEDRPLVSASPWLMEALALHARARRGVQIVTPPGARVTRPMAELLTTPLVRWVVAEGTGHRDGLSAEPLSWDPEYGFVSPRPGTRRAFPPRSEPDPDEDEHQLLVSLKTTHPADADLELGAAVELLAEHLAGGPPALLGVNEPLSTEWDRAVLTRIARRRSPGPTWMAFSGAPGPVWAGGTRPFQGTMRTRRIPDGVRETVTFSVSFPGEEAPPLDAVAEVASELVQDGCLHAMEVRRGRGPADLTRRPFLTGAMTPAAIALGMEPLERLGRSEMLNGPVPVTPLGPWLAPGAWYDLQDRQAQTPDPWYRMSLLLEQLRRPPASAHR